MIEFGPNYISSNLSNRIKFRSEQIKIRSDYATSNLLTGCKLQLLSDGPENCNIVDGFEC
jgi:hypothetical protein